MALTCRLSVPSLPCDHQSSISFRICCKENMRLSQIMGQPREKDGNRYENKGPIPRIVCRCLKTPDDRAKSFPVRIRCTAHSAVPPPPRNLRGNNPNNNHHCQVRGIRCIEPAPAPHKPSSGTVASIRHPRRVSSVRCNNRRNPVPETGDRGNARMFPLRSASQSRCSDRIQWDLSYVWKRFPLAYVSRPALWMVSTSQMYSWKRA